MEDVIHQLWYRPTGVCGFVSSKGRVTSVNNRSSITQPHAIIRWPICVLVGKWINETFGCHIRVESVNRQHENQFTITFFDSLHLVNVAARPLLIDLATVNAERDREHLNERPSTTLTDFVSLGGVEILRWIAEALTDHPYDFDLTTQRITITPKDVRLR